MDTQTKTILIVGKTGSGKSTLANVLCVDYRDQTYKIIDTPGFTEDDFSMNKIIPKSIEIVKHLKQDLTQIFIVTDGFSKVDSLLYHFLKEFVLGNYEEDDNKNAKELLTFIRTKFILYEDSKVVQKYKDALLTKASGYLAESIKGCRDILCVNHPSNSPKQGKDLMKGAQTVRDRSR